MVIRELEPSEWSRLIDHPIFRSTGVPSPDGVRVLVAENENQEIVGLWCLVSVVHAEPVWIAPEYRGSTLAGRMWRKMKVLLDHLRVDVAYCFSETPEIAGYLPRLGLTELPYRTFLYDPKHKYPRS